MYFETVSLTEPEVHLFSRAGRPVSFRDAPVLCRPAPPLPPVQGVAGAHSCGWHYMWALEI